MAEYSHDMSEDASRSTDGRWVRREFLGLVGRVLLGSGTLVTLGNVPASAQAPGGHGAFGGRRDDAAPLDDRGKVQGCQPGVGPNRCDVTANTCPPGRNNVCSGALGGNTCGAPSPGHGNTCSGFNACNGTHGNTCSGATGAGNACTGYNRCAVATQANVCDSNAGPNVCNGPGADNICDDGAGTNTCSPLYGAGNVCQGGAANTCVGHVSANVCQPTTANVCSPAGADT